MINKSLAKPYLTRLTTDGLVESKRDRDILIG